MGGALIVIEEAAIGRQSDAMKAKREPRRMGTRLDEFRAPLLGGSLAARKTYPCETAVSASSPGCEHPPRETSYTIAEP
jgi:hypothetical protein